MGMSEEDYLAAVEEAEVCRAALEQARSAFKCALNRVKCMEAQLFELTVEYVVDVPRWELQPVEALLLSSS